MVSALKTGASSLGSSPGWGQCRWGGVGVLKGKV